MNKFRKNADAHGGETGSRSPAADTIASSETAPAGSDTMALFWAEHAAWSRATFGADSERGPEGPIDHLRKEVEELAAQPGDIEEVADCIMLIFDAARRAGHGYLAVLDALRKKLDKNKARQWGPALPGKAIEHVREPEGGEANSRLDQVPGLNKSPPAIGQAPVAGRPTKEQIALGVAAIKREFSAAVAKPYSMHAVEALTLPVELEELVDCVLSATTPQAPGAGDVAEVLEIIERRLAFGGADDERDFQKITTLIERLDAEQTIIAARARGLASSPG